MEPISCLHPYIFVKIHQTPISSIALLPTTNIMLKLLSNEQLKVFYKRSFLCPGQYRKWLLWATWDDQCKQKKVVPSMYGVQKLSCK